MWAAARLPHFDLQSVALDKVEHRANMAIGACRICIFGRTPGQPEGTQFDFVVAQLTQLLVKQGHVLVAPIIGQHTDAQALQHGSPLL